MAVLTPPILIIKINKYGLNNPIKDKECQTGKNKQDLPLCYLLKSRFIFKDTNRLKVKG